MTKYNTEIFKRLATKKHNDFYSYDKSVFTKSSVPLIITCPIHGDFKQTPNAHLCGKGCKQCGIDKRTNVLKSTREEIIAKCIEIHGNKYDYSKAIYNKYNTPFEIICPEHGSFWQTPSNHINKKQECPDCKGNKKLDKETIIEKARKVHGDLYDYSKVDANGVNNYTTFICPKHGEFKQTPGNHIYRKQGCPYCNTSHLERDVESLLKYECIEYTKQQRFDWLGRQSLDFYLPNYNIAIECQGEQHFKPYKFLGGEEKLKLISSRDIAKFNKCTENGVKILYIKSKYCCNIDFSNIYKQNTYDIENISSIKDLLI